MTATTLPAAARRDRDTWVTRLLSVKTLALLLSTLTVGLAAYAVVCAAVAFGRIE